MKLKRTLGLFDIYSLASGAIISSGIFILPAIAFARSGPAVVYSYQHTGLAALLQVCKYPKARRANSSMAAFNSL